MFCRMCGNRLGDEDLFCAICGAKVENPTLTPEISEEFVNSLSQQIQDMTKKVEQLKIQEAAIKSAEEVPAEEVHAEEVHAEEVHEEVHTEEIPTEAVVEATEEAEVTRDEEPAATEDYDFDLDQMSQADKAAEAFEAELAMNMAEIVGEEKANASIEDSLASIVEEETNRAKVDQIREQIHFRPIQSEPLPYEETEMEDEDDLSDDVTNHTGKDKASEYENSDYDVTFDERRHAADVVFGTGKNSKQDHKEAEGLPKIVFALIAEAVALIAVIIMIPVILGSYYEKEAYAERFFVSLVNADVNTAYSMLDLPEGDFLSENELGKHISYGEYSKVNSYEVSYSPITEEEKELYQSILINPNAKVDFVRVYYKKKGEKVEMNMVLPLKKSGKKYLFFDNYVVDGSLMFSNDLSLTVPAGMTPYLDGVAVSDVYYDAESSAQNSQYSYYKLPNVFMGQHTLSAKADGMTSISKTDTVVSNSYNIMVDGTQYSEDVIKQLEQVAYDSMVAVYSAAKEGVDFNQIASHYTKDEESLKAIQDEYSALVKWYKDAAQTPLNFKISNIAAEGVTDSSNCKLKFEYEINFTRYNYDANKSEKGSYKSSDEVEFFFVQEDGSWVLKNLGASKLYF